MLTASTIAKSFLSALALVCLALWGDATHASDTECNSDVVEVAGAFFNLEDFHYPYPQEGGKLIAQSWGSRKRSFYSL